MFSEMLWIAMRQTLEQIGNCDSQYAPQIGSSARPFDLNCAAYQTTTNANMAHAPSNTLSTWPGPDGASPFCGQVFPDTVQEQFCH